MTKGLSLTRAPEFLLDLAVVGHDLSPVNVSGKERLQVEARS